MTEREDSDNNNDDKAGVDQPSSSSSSSKLGPIAIAMWGIALFVGCRLIEIFLEAQSMAGVVGQAVLVEYGCSRLGITWSDPKLVVTTPIIARRIGIGFGIGLGACGALFGVLVASRAAEIASVHSVEASILVIGFITAALMAWRDELLQHGVLLHALGRMNGGGGDGAGAGAGAGVSPLIKVIACGLTSGGAALGRTDADARTVFVATALGVVFGSIWLTDRGAWRPWAAHTAFRFATGTLLSGGLVHLKLADNSWAGGAAGMLGGTAAAVAVAPLAILALVWTARRISPRSSEEG